MNPIKALGWLFLVAMFCAKAVGEDLTISSPTIIETPPLIAVSSPSQLYAIGTSGTNAVLVWSKAAGDGTTNLFLNRLNEYGRAIETPPRVVAHEFYFSGHPELYPAEGGYFLRYFDRTNRLGRSRLLVKGIDFAGNEAFAPVVITTNEFKEADTASNERALLLLVENYRTAGIKLDYTILSSSGGIVSTGVLEGASGAHSFAAASDGKDFLAVWSASSAPPLRVTRFSGTDGSSSTIDLGTNTMTVQTMAHGKNGYLVAGGTSLMHLRDDGTLVARASASSIGTTRVQELIYPEGEGWILFTLDAAGRLRSFRITPTPTGLRIDDSAPYPSVSGIVYGPFSPPQTPPLVSVLAPFGPGRFLVVRDNGVSLLTKTSVNYVGNAVTYAEQKYSEIVSSPFGYLTVWSEHGGLTHSVRALRFAPDGSPLDDHSFEIASSYGASFNPPRIFEFDGKDYIVGWSGLSGISLARVAPQGAPDLRLQSYSIDVAGGSDFHLVAHKRELFASFSAMNPLSPYVLIWKLGLDGQVGPEVFIHGFYLASDGPNLFSIGVNNRSEIFKILIDPSAPNPEISTNIIAKGTPIGGGQLRHGFVVQWTDLQGNSSFGYFSNGQERLRAPMRTNSVVVAFADTDDRLIMASLPRGSDVYKFDAFNLQTGEQSYLEAVLENTTDLHLAGCAADFLVITDSFNTEMQFVAKFWISTAKPPSFAAPRIEPNFVTTTLNLEPQRRYRIETSTDLINWTLQQVVGGPQSATVMLPNDSQGFVRAMLVPE